MKFSRKPSNISFYCPMCHNKTLYCVDHDCSRPSDVDWHDNFVCDECGAEVVSEPQYDGKIRFVQDIESAEDIQDDFDRAWDAKFGPPQTRVMTLEEFDEYMDDVIKFDPKNDGKKLDKSANKSVSSALVPERPLDPPEDNRWNEMDDYEAVVQLPLDAIIFVDDDGNWDYEDEDYPWAKGESKNGDWYDEENSIYLGDKVDMVEKTDDLLFKYIPARVGTYHISGNVKLVFDISGVEEKVTDTWYDEDHGYDYDSEINTDFVDVDYIESKSEIQNFNMQPLDE